MRLNLYKRLLYQKLKNNKVVLVYIPLIIYWIILFTATTLPGKSLPKVAVSDKIKHLAGYFILSGLVYLTLHFQKKFRKLSRQAVVWTLVIVGTYGMLDEIHQLFVPGRSCDLLDWIADMTGSVIAIFVIGAIIKAGSLINNGGEEQTNEDFVK